MFLYSFFSTLLLISLFVICVFQLQMIFSDTDLSLCHIIVQKFIFYVNMYDGITAGRHFLEDIIQLCDKFNGLVHQILTCVTGKYNVLFFRLVSSVWNTPLLHGMATSFLFGRVWGTLTWNCNLKWIKKTVQSVNDTHSTAFGQSQMCNVMNL